MSRRVICVAVMSLVVAGGFARGVPMAQNAYLYISAIDKEFEIVASAWGKVEPGEGEHVEGSPPRGTDTLSIVTDGETFPILSGLEAEGADSIFGKGGSYITLTFRGGPGEDRVYKFDLSGLSCTEKNSVCTFVFNKVEVPAADQS